MPISVVVEAPENNLVNNALDNDIAGFVAENSPLIVTTAGNELYDQNKVA
jgi:hypothetical protein